MRLPDIITIIPQRDPSAGSWPRRAAFNRNLPTRDGTGAGQRRPGDALFRVLKHGRPDGANTVHAAHRSGAAGRVAGLALLLSTVGIFALVANMVVERTGEIEIRIAGTGLRASVVGLAVGLVLCAGALRAIRSVLYGVGVYDAPTIVAVVTALFSITLLASSAPALRIARIDPAKTLREE
jgi:hypothetical protein